MSNSKSGFISRLDASRKSTFLVAEYLHRSGYAVNIPAFDYNENNEHWEDHVDDGDLYIQKPNGPSYRIDVKHISTSFTQASDFPFSHMFVADIRAIERANPFPLAYVVVNKECTHMGIVWGKTKQYWETYEVFASNTNKMITVKRCPLQYVDFRSFDR